MWTFKWNTIVDSPVGDQSAVLLVQSSGDTFTGTWTDTSGTIAVRDGKVDGDDLSWNVSITTPFPMTLDCRATVTGDAIAGTVKAGNFGTFPLTGTRA